LLEIRSRRGRARARCRIAPIKPGTLFMPFHYGYFDDDQRSARAANELTIAEWDPVSKQPYFKYAAVQISSVEK
jgi:anaerobic selenocysteine-containing dehydrogenase